MPQFVLNQPANSSHPFYSLNAFERGYVEAMFFTNCDSGDEDEFIANRLGVESLTVESIEAIKEDCKDFLESGVSYRNGNLVSVRDFLAEASESSGYSDEQAGNDFWFTRQGHGVGYWDREQLDAAAQHVLTNAAKEMGEVYPTIDGERIYYR